MNALRAFEAAARHGSMTRAAEELHVTPGALSHQIRGLEEFLDLKLFERLPRAIQLTVAGEALFPGLQAGFRQINEALAALGRVLDPNVLVVSTPPGLTAKWLAPRLYRYAEAAPDVEVRISSSARNADFVTDGVDLAIRNVGDRDPPGRGLAQDRLAEIRVLPVCAPSVIERFGPFSTAADLARAPLIQDETFLQRAGLPSWADWLKAAGAPQAAHGNTLSFNSSDHALDAAAQGGGVLLAHEILAYDDMKSGRLVAPFELALPTGRSYALVYPKGATDRTTVAAFRAWIMEEMRAMLADDIIASSRGKA